MRSEAERARVQCGLLPGEIGQLGESDLQLEAITMVEVFLNGGKTMWPLVLIGAGILILASRTAWDLRRGDGAHVKAERRLQAILFWGVLSALLGFLGTIIGIISATRAVALAGEVEPPVVFSGLGIVLTTLVFGLVIFLVASVLWFTLRQWYQRAARGSQPGAATPEP